MADTGTPALRLPADIILHLAAFFRPRPPEIENEPVVGQVSLATWASLPSVCRNWREVCLGSPSYWSYIVLPNDHTHPSRSLARAQDAPLDVVVHVAGDMNVDDEVMIAEGLSLLEDHTQQIRSFLVRNYGDHPVRKALLACLADLLCRPLPQLNHLRFHDGAPFPRDFANAIAPTRTVAFEAPSLLSISMQGYHRFDWTRKTTLIHGLRSVHLAFLSFSDMRGALARLPRLQSAVINLGESQLARGVDWVPPPKSLIWPALRELTLRCHPGDLPTFWEALDVPASVQVTIIVIHRSPYIAAVQSRAVLSTALSMFLPTRTSSPSPSMLDALTVTRRRVDDEDDVKVALNWHAEGIRAQTSSSIGEGAPWGAPGQYSTSIVTERSVLPVALDFLDSSIPNLKSLYLDRADMRGIFVADAVTDCIPDMSALHVLFLRGQANTLSILAYLGSTEELYLPSLEQLTIEDAELVGQAEQCLNAYLVKRLEANIPLKSLTLIGCLTMHEMDFELSLLVESVINIR